MTSSLGILFYAFLWFAGVETEQSTSVKHREERAPVSRELDTQRHVLRQMQGRRRERLDPGEFVGTQNPSRPVYKQV